MAHLNRISLVSLVALGVAMPAFAQEATTQPAAEPETTRGDVVVITANKREETVQDVAVAVTAVTSEMRDELGIRSITDLTNLTPGLSYTAGNERVTLRGIGRNTNNFGAEPGVANYTDGIYQSFASIAGRDNLFVDRIEVLRGPQGTLYGRNSVGGALNIVSKRPTDEFTGELVLGIGNFEQAKAGASLSGTLIEDWLRGRVVAVKEVRDEGVFYNFGTNDTEGYNINNWNAEIQFEGDIGDRFSWWTKYTSGGYKMAGPPGGRTTGNSISPYDVNSFGSLAGTGSVGPNQYWAFGNGVANGGPSLIGYTQCGSTTTNPTLTDSFAVNSCGTRIADLQAYDDYALEMVYEADGFDIKYLGGYIYYDYHLTDDQDGSPIKTITYNSLANGAAVPFGTPGSSARTIFPENTLHYNENRAFFSNEVNFISTHEGPLQWITGIYAYQENFQQPVETSYKNEPLASQPNMIALNAAFGFAGFAAPNPDRLASHTNNKGLNNSYGVYGQVDYEINDQWKTTVGIRYSVDNKHIQETARLFCYVQCGATYADVTQAIWNGRSPLDATNGPQPGVSTATLANPSGVTINPVTGNAERTLENEWDAWTGTAGLEYRPWDDTMLFAKYSRGYKTGGFNATDMAPLPMTGEETVNAYELGWKQEMFEYGLTANMSLFYYDYQDVQIPVGVQPDVGPGYTSFVNMPQVETTGFEIETVWNPIDDLTIRATYAWLNAEITESGRYVNPLCVSPADLALGRPAPDQPATCPGIGSLPGQSVEGNLLPQAPEHKIALNASYMFNFEDGSTLMPSISYYWRDSFTTSIFNDPRSFTPDFDQTDARLIWNDADGLLTVIGWVRNAFDEDGFDAVTAGRRRSLDATQNNQIYQTFTPTLPRMYGVELQVHF